MNWYNPQFFKGISFTLPVKEIITRYTLDLDIYHIRIILSVTNVIGNFVIGITKGTIDDFV